MAKHPGFKGAQASIAKRSGVGMERAGAILAASTRKASPAAVRKNPRLLNVARKAQRKSSRTSRRGGR